MSTVFASHVAITGDRESLSLLRRAARRPARSRRGSRRRGGAPAVPWSFEKLFQRHFELRAECGEAPWDDGAYSTEVSRIAKWEQHWRLRLFIEVKNVEIHEILRPLSGLYPSLCFSCAELCLDDGSIVGRLIHRRRLSTWEMPDTRQDVHWRAAAKAFDIDDLEEAYEDDVIRYDAESAMFEEALVRWDAKVRVKLQRARTDDRSG